MGKIGISATKYIIRAKLTATGVVEKPDVIGAIFGQTEGLLGEELELRELQKNGRIGRIEVNVTSAEGKSEGDIEIPTSLSKEDTALIAAALETIERIGPCDATIKVTSVDDVRSTKRDYVIERAKSILGDMGKETPESQELTEMVKEKVRVAEITELGPDKLSAGPDAETSDEIILVEGRADVLNLMKHGMMNVIGLGGTSIPQSIKDICAQKRVTVFLDGDRGGDLILKELLQITDVDFVAKAPPGREVEELTSKEIIKALRTRLTKDEAIKQLEQPAQQQNYAPQPSQSEYRQQEQAQIPAPHYRGYRPSGRREYGSGRGRDYSRGSGYSSSAAPRPRMEYREEFGELANVAATLIGTGQVALLKQSGTKFKEVGRVPRTDISDVLKNIPEGKAQALVVDGEIDQSLANETGSKGITYLIGSKKPRFLKRKPGLYVMEASFLRKLQEEHEASKK